MTYELPSKQIRKYYSSNFQSSPTTLFEGRPQSTNRAQENCWSRPGLTTTQVNFYVGVLLRRSQLLQEDPRQHFGDYDQAATLPAALSAAYAGLYSQKPNGG